MKSFGVIMIVLLVLIIGGSIFVFLNQPAQLIVRKAFRAYAKIEIVSTKEYDGMRESNRELTIKQELSRVRQDSLQSAVELMESNLAQSNTKIAAQQNRINSLVVALNSAKEPFDNLTLPEKFGSFDKLTAGEKQTFLFMHEGSELALTEPQRIVDATWKLMEGNSFRLQVEAHREQVIEMQQRNEQLISINGTLRQINEECQEDKAIEVAKRENCEAAEKNTLLKAKGFAGGGLVALILTIAIIVL